MTQQSGRFSHADEAIDKYRHRTDRIFHKIRIWNVEQRMKQKTVIVVKSKERGARTQVTACAYSPDGKLIAGGKELQA